MIQTYFFVGVLVGLGIGIMMVVLWGALAISHYRGTDAEDRDSEL